MADATPVGSVRVTKKGEAPVDEVKEPTPKIPEWFGPAPEKAKRIVILDNAVRVDH